MSHLGRGAVSSASTPLLAIWTCNDKLLLDPDPGSLSFSVVDISTEDKDCVPVVVVPITSVDLVADRVGLGVGRFAASFAVPAAEPEGAHEILWSWSIANVAYGYVERFDVLAGVPRGLGAGGYSLVSDFRAEGLTVAAASNLRLLKLILEQSLYIDQVTGRWFEARFRAMALDGTDGPKLLVGEPIIALAGLLILDDPVPIDPTSRELVIYNRHLRGLLEPDDRRAPRVEIPEFFPLVDSYYAYGSTSSQLGVRTGFPKSAQNVQIQGLFGYRDPNGSPLGGTPAGIQKALRLLVLRNLATLACDEEGFDKRFANRVTSMTTRDQSITFAPAGLGQGSFTSDLEIDNALSPYARPMRLYAT